MVSVFVGEGRKALVQGIVNRLDNLTDYKDDSNACLISLEAPSGWGKTRIIQEVYKQIAERQTSTYWPKSIIPEDEDDPVSRRKHLEPSFEGVPRNRDILPEFFWWGLTCDMRSTNMLSRTLIEDIDQLRFHAPYLEASWAASKLTRLGKYATVAKAKSALGALFEEGAVTGLSKLAELGLGATPFGIGLGLKLVTSSAKALKNKKEEHAQMSKGYEDHETIDQGLVDETVNLLSRLAHKELPIIICVEDIHKATTPVLELLTKMLARNAPILIVTTTWPGEFEKIKELKALLDSSWAQDRIIRMEYDKPTPKGLPEKASLSQLPLEDLSKIILARYPKAEENAVQLLTERYKNPLPLELVLNMKSLKRDHPYLELDADDVSKLPEKVRDLYNSLWNELPDPVQQLLALSTELMPEGQPEWLMTLIADALSALKDEDWANDVSMTVANDNIPHGWSRIVEGWLRRFGEADQLDIARAHVGELFGKRQLKLFNGAAAAQIERDALESFLFLTADMNDVEVMHKAWLATAFYELGKVSAETYLSASAYIMKSISSEPLEWSKAISFGQTLMRHLAPLVEQVSNPNNKTDSSVILNAYKKLISDAQILLLEIYQMSKKLNDAKDILQLCLNNQIRMFGLEHPSVFIVRNQIATSLDESGAGGEAIKEWEALLEDEIRILGPDSPQVLITRNNIAVSQSDYKSSPETLKAFEALLEDTIRILGPNHPELLTVKLNIANALTANGAVLEALEMREDLLEDQILILGSDHPHVFKNRRQIARCLADTKGVSHALEALNVVMEDQTRILGPDHPDVLTTRHNIAFLLGENEFMSEALEALKALLEDEIRILGADHQNVLATRNNIAYWLWESGAVSEALVAHKAVLEDSTFILGPDHPDVLMYRFNIAFLLGQSGLVLESLEALNALLQDQTRILSVDHPDTIRTQVCLSYYQEKLDAQKGE